MNSNFTQDSDDESSASSNLQIEEYDDDDDDDNVDHYDVDQQNLASQFPAPSPPILSNSQRKSAVIGNRESSSVLSKGGSTSLREIATPASNVNSSMS